MNTLSPTLQSKVHLFSYNLSHHIIYGSHQIAQHTLNLLLEIIQEYEIKSIDNVSSLLLLLQHLALLFNRLIEYEIASTNITLRVIKLIRLEITSFTTSATTTTRESNTTSTTTRESNTTTTRESNTTSTRESNTTSTRESNTTSAKHTTTTTRENKSITNLHQDIIFSVQELLSELSHIHDNIATQSLDHIHSDEIILTSGKSITVEGFLLYAWKKGRKFRVVLVEGREYVVVWVLCE